MAEPNVSPLFHHANADITIRSCDNVEFRLHKVILEMASPIFRDMFTLPASPSHAETPQVVDVEESARTLEDLLPFCYPMERSEFLQLSRLSAVFHAARKYEMAFLVNVLKRNLALFLPSEPLRVYAIACLTEEPVLARAAAKALLDHPFPQFPFPQNPPPEYAILSAAALQNVHTYRERCAEAALEIVRDKKTMLERPGGSAVAMSRKGNADASGSWVWFDCRACSPGSMMIELSNNATGRWGELRPRAWWEKYLALVVRQLALRPLGATVTEPQLLRATVAEAAACTKCGPKGAQHLYQYAEGMAKRIDEATSKIEIELPFRESTSPAQLVEPEE